MEYKFKDYIITTDTEKADLDAISALLGNSYWAAERSRDTIAASIKNSICFNLFHQNRQIGFGRFITDHAVFGYICDIIIDEEHRGQGLGKWLVECILAYPGVENLKTILLGTKDAHGLYQKYGFSEIPDPKRIMHRIKSLQG